jgi:hypothetical protein
MVVVVLVVPEVQMVEVRKLVLVLASLGRETVSDTWALALRALGLETGMERSASGTGSLDPEEDTCLLDYSEAQMSRSPT